MCHCFSGQIERQAAPGEDGNHQNWTSSLRNHQHFGPLIVFIQTAPSGMPHCCTKRLHILFYTCKCNIKLQFLLHLSKIKAKSLSCPTVSAWLLVFCFASVTGEVPAQLLLLTAPTSSFPDFRETVIVSAPALKGSAGCFQSTHPVYLFFVSPQVFGFWDPLHFRFYIFPSLDFYLTINVWQHCLFSCELMINTYETAL